MNLSPDSPGGTSGDVDTHATKAREVELQPAVAGALPNALVTATLDCEE